jgi:hypothetical protein
MLETTQNGIDPSPVQIDVFFIFGEKISERSDEIPPITMKLAISE